MEPGYRVLLQQRAERRKLPPYSARKTEDIAAHSVF
jgi:hypothetical protein